jgi:hypothetical protein
MIAILKDILSGALPIGEILGFLYWYLNELLEDPILNDLVIEFHVDGRHQGS